MDTQTDQVIEVGVHDILKVIVSLCNENFDVAFVCLFATRVMGGCHWFFVTTKYNLGIWIISYIHDQETFKFTS